MTEHTDNIMPCMEVWGGNEAVDRGVMMLGLDAWLYSRPHAGDRGGGDVHFVSSCATGRITRLLVADVSGHGSAVAETGEALRRLMRRYVNHIDQGRLIAALNREFVALSSRGSFATSVVGTFFGPTNDLTICNAGHPPPLLYRGRDSTWSFIDRPSGGTRNENVPLGILDDGRYEQQSVKLAVGDLVLLYTDSLIEARDAEGGLLGTQGLIEIVGALDPARPEALITDLLEAIAALADGNLTDDDITVLLVRPNGLGPRVPLSHRAAAPLRLVGALASSLRPGGRPMPWPQLSVPNIGGAIIPGLSRLFKPGSSSK